MSIQLHSIKGYNGFRKVYDVGMKFRSNNTSAIVVFSDVLFSEMLERIHKFADIHKNENRIENNNESNSNNYSTSTSNDFKHIIYYGVTIGKKVAKKAVVRNRIKRLMRESLRIAVKELEIKKLLPIEKIIISYYFAPKYPMQIGLNDVLPAVKNILKQAYLYYSSINENNKNNN